MCKTDNCSNETHYTKCPYCRECRTAKDRLKRFGITKEEYENLMIEQDYLCAICGQPETAVRRGRLKQLAVDHDHDSGKIRGLLCQRCNVGLGQFQDDPELLEAAFSYMKGGTCRT